MRPSDSASPCANTSRWLTVEAKLRFALQALLAHIVGTQSSVDDVDEPVEVVVVSVMALQAVIVVQEVVVEVMMVLEEPLEAKEVDRTTVSLQDGTAVPLVQEAELDDEDDDDCDELAVSLAVLLPVLLSGALPVPVGLLLPLPQSITHGRLLPALPPPPPPQPKRQSGLEPPLVPPGDGASIGGGPGGPGSGHPGGEVDTAQTAPPAVIELVVVVDESDSITVVA